MAQDRKEKEEKERAQKIKDEAALALKKAQIDKDAAEKKRKDDEEAANQLT